MVTDYLFSYDKTIEFDFDMFDLSSGASENKRYLVSNILDSNAEIYAPEINFYLDNSVDEKSRKIENIKKLYQARSTAIDYDQTIEFSTPINKTITIISEEDQPDLKQKLSERGFVITTLSPTDIIAVQGHIGEITLSCLSLTDPIDIIAEQIIWFNAPEPTNAISGLYDPEQADIEGIINKVTENCGEYTYSNYIKYNVANCLQTKKREPICHSCADICPTNGIIQQIHNNELLLSDIDCIGCGNCISVCPSGALTYAPMPRIAFKEISFFYKEQIALLFPKRMCLEELELRLEKDVLPFPIDHDDLLDESNVMTLLQTTGRPIILYTDNISDTSKNIFQIINQIYQKKYNRPAIYVCKDANEIEQESKNALPFADGTFQLDAVGLRKREIFSLRLAHLVKNDDFGTITTGPQIHYGNITLNGDTCTLCLSCVDTCNTGALTAHPEDNTLRYNPSLCTQCEHCENVCPETDCLHLVPDTLSLTSSYFRDNIIARDEIFKCIECGMGFAPVKSVSKIIEMMTPVFTDNPLKLRALSCCTDCKARIMLEGLSIDTL